jgi:AcrR family transcriptional regulator
VAQGSLTAAAAGPIRADAARNRARILAAARSELNAGKSALQPNVVARVAGVGVGTVYRHFPTVHALYEALAEERFDELVAVTQSGVADPDPMAGLQRMLEFALRSASDPGFAEVLEAATDVGEHVARRRVEFEQALKQILARARRDGSARADVTAKDVVLMLCGIQHTVRSGAVTARQAHRFVTVLVDGIRAARRD